MEIAPGLHRIGNDIVACYLVVTPDGVTLVDAGLAGFWGDLQTELDSVGCRIADVKGLILTHGDNDHLGFAEKLRREHDVPVYIHSADVDRAKGGRKPATARQPMKLGPVLQFFAFALRKGGLRTSWLSSVTEVHDGETLDLPGSPRIIALPGHSPGSIAVFVPSVDAVFVGDGLTTRHVLTGVVGPAPAPFTDNPAEAIASLTALLPTRATWVLPGHGAPFGGGIDAAVAAVNAAR